ncbi:putative aminopeptidase W07G4.4 [Patella vulgata]|uniref:putative aminopeptidase W07G4.4 n=1 Tax=Patella vulgata TaxID=6465 RepID=UPI0024A86F91|nr:putative aminopeptidase W07G4.4 [Patella vulgata]
MATPSLPRILPCLDVTDIRFDSVVVVTDSINKLTDDNLKCLEEPLRKYSKLDELCGKSVVLVHTENIPSNRLIFSPTGKLNRDYDDVRSFADAAVKGIKRAREAGSISPLLVRPIDDSFPKAGLVATLGALHDLYVPLEIRETVFEKRTKVESLGIWCNNEARLKAGIEISSAIELGRIICRDIGGSDPERMAAQRVEEYVLEVFKDTGINVNIISDVNMFKKEYPLLAAVNRAADVVERHRGRIIFLEYVGDGSIEKTLFLVGKGITYDTGGADIKAGGVMAGMHRDKCGAAAVAGFFKTLSILKPKGLRVVGGMAMVRNSVGEESYVADEIITSRAGVRVRVGNTDAEGRMVMADLLCKFKEMALEAVNPELMTIATLTGHAVRAMGTHYTIIMDNGPAKLLQTAQTVQTVGDIFGDPFEISTIRREDYDFIAGKSEYEDVLQCNNQASSATPRGHQFPAAFLIRSSGLDKHGIDSDKPIPYSHLDIAGSSGPFPGVPTGAPLPALTAKYILNRLQ